MISGSALTWLIMGCLLGAMATHLFHLQLSKKQQSDQPYQSILDQSREQRINYLKRQESQKPMRKIAPQNTGNRHGLEMPTTNAGLRGRPSE